MVFQLKCFDFFFDVAIATETRQHRDSHWLFGVCSTFTLKSKQTLWSQKCIQLKRIRAHSREQSRLQAAKTIIEKSSNDAQFNSIDICLFSAFLKALSAVCSHSPFSLHFMGFGYNFKIDTHIQTHISKGQQSNQT